MKPIDYFNLPNKNNPKESDLEHRISSAKKAGLTLVMIASLAPAGLGLLSNPAYETQRDDKKQEQKFIIKTLDARVGKEYVQLKDKDTLSMLYDMDFYLNPQTQKGLMTEFLIKLPEKNKILNEIYQTDYKGYVCDRFGNRVKITNQTMRFKDYGLKQGQRPTLDCTYELPTRLFQTAQIFVQLLPGQEEKKIPEQMQEQAPVEIKELGKPLPIQRQNPPPNPQSVLDELKKDLVAEADSEREEKQKQKQKSRGPAVLIPKFAYVLKSENPDDAKAQRTGKGVFGELEYAKPNVHLWAGALSLSYDDEILVLGGSTIKNVFTDADLGFEAKTSRGFGLVGGINMKSTHKEWLPNRTPLFAPEMANYDFKSVYAGIGAAMGDYDKSFIQGMIYGGYGKLVETIHRPGSYYINDMFAGSESFWEWFYKVNGRLDFDPVRLEGTWTKGKSTNKATDLTRDVETLNGKAMISLGVLSKSLGNLYVGVFAHRFKSTDINMPFEDFYFGPLAVLEIPLNSHRK